MRRVYFCLLALLVVSSVFGVQVSFDTTGGNHLLFNDIPTIPLGWEPLSFSSYDYWNDSTDTIWKDELTQMRDDGYNYVVLWDVGGLWRHGRYETLGERESILVDILQTLIDNEMKAVFVLPVAEIGFHLYPGSIGFHLYPGSDGFDASISQLYGHYWRWGWPEPYYPMGTKSKGRRRFVDLGGDGHYNDSLPDPPADSVITTHAVKSWITGCHTRSDSADSADKALQGMCTEISCVLEFNFEDTSLFPNFEGCTLSYDPAHDPVVSDSANSDSVRFHFHDYEGAYADIPVFYYDCPRWSFEVMKMDGDAEPMYFTFKVINSDSVEVNVRLTSEFLRPDVPPPDGEGFLRDTLRISLQNTHPYLLTQTKDSVTGEGYHSVHPGGIYLSRGRWEMFHIDFDKLFEWDATEDSGEWFHRAHYKKIKHIEIRGRHFRIANIAYMRSKEEVWDSYEDFGDVLSPNTAPKQHFHR